MLDDSPVLLATGMFGHQEYRFYEFPNGNPPRRDGLRGQVKAFVCTRCSFEHRVPFDKLPTTALQLTFVECTGKKPEDLGVTVMQ